MRTSSESQSASAPDSLQAVASTGAASQPVTVSPQPGSGSTSTTPKNKQKKTNTPKKAPKQSKVRLAANFGPANDT